MKKIAVLNDLSGMGKCSLTAAIPVISVMGIQACPLPTAVLSCQTGFPSYYCDDYTDRMDIIIDEWKKLNFVPDGIYTGFLADAAQADKAVRFIREFKTEDTRILVDPVMGDDGEEYPIYTEELCGKMRFLVQEASVITPNLTEALLLLYGREKAHTEWKNLRHLSEKEHLSEVEKIGQQLTGQFQVEAVITGVSILSEKGETLMGNLICQKDSQTLDHHQEGRGKLFRHRRSFCVCALRWHGKGHGHCGHRSESSDIYFQRYSRCSGGRHRPKRRDLL